jgi:probable DNA repair protein
MLGFHDELWPPQAHPNPFLPFPVQRRLGVPRASPWREFEFAQRETLRILASAPRVIASHAAQVEDRVLDPSPLLESLPLEDLSRIERCAQDAWRTVVHAAANLERLSDFRAPSLGPGPQSGGVRLFQDQSACPFLAFARHRLHAESLEQPAPGLSARERGIFVHKALEQVWEQVRTHAALLEFSEAELRGISREAAEAAVEGETGDRARAALLNLEKQRLAGLLLAELQVEKARAPFEVLAREEPRDASFGGVTVRTRVDRIDRLPGGGHVLIDYKSGASAVTPAAWLGQRLDEPQLPLYCASSELPVAAVVFARVSRRALRETVKSARQPKLFVGLSDSAEWFPREEFSSVGLFSDFAPRGSGAAFGSRDEALRSWRGVLDTLGNRFREGDASVDPKRSGTGQALPCERCDLQALCRIHEVAGRLDEEAAPIGDEAAHD